MNKFQEIGAEVVLALALGGAAWGVTEAGDAAVNGFRCAVDGVTTEPSASGRTDRNGEDCIGRLQDLVIGLGEAGAGVTVAAISVTSLVRNSRERSF